MSSSDDDVVTEIKMKMSNLDFGDPLYLHASDTNSAPLVSFKLKGTENYSVWSCAVLLALETKNKVGFIDGSCVKPTYDEALSRQWDRCNAVVLTWILGSISEELYMGQIFSRNAKVVWSELKETYDKVDGSITFNLHHQINSLTQNGSTISEYYHKLNSLWKQFDALVKLPRCTCEAANEFHDHNDLMKLMQFLMGLDEVYQPIRSNILTRDPLPSVKTAFAIISREESHRVTSNPGSSKGQTSAFVGKVFNDNRRNPSSQNRSHLICQKCKMTGHTIDRCYELVGYPPNYKKKNIFQNKKFSSHNSSNNLNPNLSKTSSSTPFTQEQIEKLMCLISNNKVVEDPRVNMAGNFFCSNSFNKVNNGWIIDSGANQHMVSTKENLENIMDISDF